MRVLGGDNFRIKVDAQLDDLASGNAEIVPLQVSSFSSRLLRLRHAQRQTASDDQRRYYRYNSSRFHVDLLFVLQIARATHPPSVIARPS